MKIYVDFQDDPLMVGVTEIEVEVVPRVGEKVGIRQPEPWMKSRNAYALDTVVDVRHYIANKNAGTGKPPEWEHEIRVLTSMRP